MTADDLAYEITQRRVMNPGSTVDDLRDDIATGIRAAEQEAERQCLDMVHGYYVERMSTDQRRAVDQTVIAIRGAIRARAKQTERAQERGE